MGKKINPVFYRLGITTKYHSIWFSKKKKFFFLLKCSILVREILKKNFFHINLSYIDIIISNVLKINFYLNDILNIENIENKIDFLILHLSKILKKNIIINFILDEEINAKFIAVSLLNQILIKNSIKKTIKKEIIKYDFLNGCKIQISGRLDGADIARKEWFLIGKIPLHCIKNTIDYYNCEVITQYGITGIKVWILKKKNEIKT